MFENAASVVRNGSGGSLPFADLAKRVSALLRRVKENKKMGADLLFMSTYMAAITTAGVTRPEIFAYTSERREYVPSRYIEKAEKYVRRWNYSYVEGLLLVADKVENEMLRSLLNRYANSIESGVPDEDFLTRELETVRSVYRNTFEQGLEMLKKWGDAYIAMLFSASLVGIIIMISVAIYSPEGIESSLNTAYLLIIAISVMGLAIMYRSVPDDVRTHRMPQWCSREQAMIRRIERLVLPVAVVGSLLLLLLGGGFGMVFLLAGVLLAPLGFIGFVDDTNIVQRDRDFPTFIRSLGSVMGGKGINTVFALAEVDRKSLIHLEPLIDSVYSKLNLGLDEKRSWERFIGESGSNLIYKYMNIFRDAVELGGSPDRIGQIIGSSMLEQVLLREKRDMFYKGFIVLLIPMHAAMVGIFLFLFHILLLMAKGIAAVMEQFGGSESALSGPSSVGGQALGGMGLFVNFPEGQMTVFVVIIISLLTLFNVIAGKIVAGGDRYMFYFFASLLCIITGALYIAAPIAVHMFFDIPGLGGA
ncbi:MAG: archaellar assembly protein FlaJ [Methanomicrobiales archaeon]|nr:archaellar assembly protein FlaJ [Methanomicrobiales archaeon]MDI6877330.1 archaellar assembly protein FlaJ [Methanomicrobiales archaeon]